MAVDLKPTAIFPGWTYADGTITLPRTDLYGLSASDCDPVTGDGRKVILAVLKTAYERYNEMAEKPAGMMLRYEPGQFVTYGDFMEKVKSIFRVNAYVLFPEETIAPEPT